MTDSHVLITGETGTGKELAAQYIHQHSARSTKPLVTINCAALPDGLLESELFGYERGAFTGALSSYAGKLKLADGGTVLFDEIGEMSPYAQAKILRVIETKEVYPLGGRRSVPINIRIIAATNRDLDHRDGKQWVSSGSVFSAERCQDQVATTAGTKRRYSAAHRSFRTRNSAQQFGREIEGFTDEAMELLKRNNWPGNIRELMNLVERIFIDPPAEKIAVRGFAGSPCDPLGRSLAGTLSPKNVSSCYTRLSQTNWNKSQAAERLHWSRMTLYRKMAKYHIKETTLENSKAVSRFAQRL